MTWIWPSLNLALARARPTLPRNRTDMPRSTALATTEPNELAIVREHADRVLARFDPQALVQGKTALEIELAELADIEITDDETAEIVAIDVREKMRERDAVEALRKSVTGPLDQTKSIIQGWFVPFLDVYKKYRETAGAKVAAYQQTKNEARRAALAEATKAMQTGDAFAS